MTNLIVRTITGVLFVAAIVVCFLNPMAMTLLFGIITGLTVWEFCGVVNSREGVDVNRFICTVAGVFFFIAMTGFCSDVTPSTVFIPYLITIVYLLVAELYAKNADPINNWAYTMMSQLYIALPLSLVNVLAYRATPVGVEYTYLMPLSIFIFLWLNDTGAYCFGSTLGRHRLFPRISPKKSWEGSAGGAVVAVGGAVLMWFLADKHDVNDMSLSVYQWIGLALIVVIFGTWGDLVESLFKRTMGIKDSGTILPGHGGMLDRFDSALLAIPAAVIYLYSLTLF